MSNYVTKAADIWSIGCIFGEILLRKKLFQGKSKTDQLKIIVEALGTPDFTDIKASSNVIECFI
jgi:serine/threonine protein kinase